MPSTPAPPPTTDAPAIVMTYGPRGSAIAWKKKKAADAAEVARVAAAKPRAERTYKVQRHCGHCGQWLMAIMVIMVFFAMAAVRVSRFTPDPDQQATVATFEQEQPQQCYSNVIQLYRCMWPYIVCLWS